MCDSLFGSPARSIGEKSIGDPNSLTDSEITESESETFELTPDVPAPADHTIVDGWVKFRDNKRWKQRWGVVTKLSPAADCLHLQLYRDSRDRYKQGQTKASLSLQHFLGVETGFTLDKESNTIAIICQDVTVVLAFDTRERLIQWQVKISSNLGDDRQFLVLVSQAPPKAKISTGPARLHVRELKFCMTSGVPPRLVGFWEIGHLRRYGVVEGRFCFEGGSRCGRWEGLHVLVTDQGPEITESFRMAAQGKLASRRRQVSRKSSATESPRKYVRSRPESGAPDSFASGDVDGDGDQQCRMRERSDSPFWSVESRRVDLDSDYGCGDTASVRADPDAWPDSDGRGVPPSLERCLSCISKLGAPTLSRSSTANASTPFGPAWTMEPMAGCGHATPTWGPGSDRLSVSSRATGSSGGSDNSEYSVPRHVCREVRTCPPLPPKTVSSLSPADKCRCRPPSRPPKPADAEPPAPSPTRKKLKKPPMPLPQGPPCSCDRNDNDRAGPYENYDVPRNTSLRRDGVRPVLDKQPLRDPSNRVSASPPPTAIDFYDTPRNIRENLCSAGESLPNYGNYDTPPPAKTIRKPCGCIVTFARQAVDADAGAECPCRRVLCWAENWMLLPYCKRGRGVDSASVPVHKVKLSGEGKMPVVNASGEIAVYATVDKAKKSSAVAGHPETNYVNVGPGSESGRCDEKRDGANYQNMDFANSLELYENSKELLQKVSVVKREEEEKKRDKERRGPEDDKQDEGEEEKEEGEDKTPSLFSLSNGVKVCNKCGHPCQPTEDKREGDAEDTRGDSRDASAEQEDYMMMQPSNRDGKKSGNFPGYLPMFPSNKAEAPEVNSARGFSAEKSASVSSLPACTQRGRKRSECQVRVPGSAGAFATGKIYFSRLRESDEESGKPRKRSSSADSSRYLEEYDEVESEANSPLKRCKSPPAEKVTSNSLTSLPYQSPKKNAKGSPDSNDGRDSIDDELYERTIVEDLTGIVDDEDCSSSGSLRTLVHEGLQDAAASGTAFIRRSSSVPCKSGNNRDSSSSNDSGVSTGSLKYRGGDFTEFELPLTTSVSARRHRSVVQRHPGTTCLHSSLPRRSKSSDPLRDLAFNFQTAKIPEKSSSAEAEVPICATKKGYFSPGDAATVPYMDSRSTSSGTSDMSDYIETLSLSSHSSSDAPDTTLHRITRISATTLRPRSGNEYHKIDRSVINGELIVKQNQRGHFYANIGPLPEKSESPSPGYMSSSPAHEVQCNEY